MSIVTGNYATTSTDTFTYGNNIVANASYKIDLENRTVVKANVTPRECWNEYCWDEVEYQTAVEEHIFPEDYEWFFIAIYGITFIVGLVGNLLVCFAVWRNHNMRTVTNVFIVNLAVGDCLVILLCLPPTLIQNVTLTWFFGPVLCKLLIFLQNTSVSVSVLTLSAIAVERWYAICYPLRLKSTIRRARNMIVTIWLTSMFVALPELIVSNTLPYDYPAPFVPTPPSFLTACKPVWASWKQSIYQLSLAIALYIAPIVLMTITYCHIAIVLWVQKLPGEILHVPQSAMVNDARSSVGCQQGQSVHNDQLVSRRKVAKMLIAIVAVFAVCFLPVHLMNILRYFDVLKFQRNISSLQPLVSHWLPYFNSALNPIIYNFMSAKFRKEFKVACFCCFHDFRYRPSRRRCKTYTLTFSHSNYSNCHTKDMTLASFNDR